MKNLGLTVLLFLLISYSYAQKEITWHSFDEVVKLVEEEPRMVLVDVYTDWCGWCKKMDKDTFTDAEVVEYINNNFYAVKLNAENRKKKFEFKGKEYSEETMARAMQVRSYPNFVIMDAAMENITQLPGYREPKPFLTALDGLVDKFKN